MAVDMVIGAQKWHDGCAYGYGGGTYSGGNTVMGGEYGKCGGCGQGGYDGDYGHGGEGRNKCEGLYYKTKKN